MIHSSLLLAASLALAANTPGEIQLPDGGKKLHLPPACKKADTEGLKLLSEGSYDEAVSAFERSLRLARGNPRALANRGVAFAHLGRLDEALKDYEGALNLAPELKPALKGPIVDARVRRGHGRFDGGDVTGALGDFYTAIRANPRDPRGYAAVAEAARKTGQPDTCVRYGSRALELGVDSADVLSDRAGCLATLGRNEEALKDLDRAIALDPRHGDLYQARALVELDLRKKAAARRDAEKAVELDSSLRDKLPAELR